MPIRRSWSGAVQGLYPVAAPVLDRIYAGGGAPFRCCAGPTPAATQRRRGSCQADRRLSRRRARSASAPMVPVANSASSAGSRLDSEPQLRFTLWSPATSTRCGSGSQAAALSTTGALKRRSESGEWISGVLCSVRHASRRPLNGIVAWFRRVPHRAFDAGRRVGYRWPGARGCLPHA